MLDKHFSFGYYTKSGFGNEENYQFGNNFFITLIPDPAPVPLTKDLKLDNSCQKNAQ
jgi:hypothetical protein